ncbi:helix-turn-helix domain-containing protein [Trinickia violacea]|uniref:Helix-turn-helix domain-containing protein n=1 Tax=Trinickia violacea TaxID=2571746 RepID=A0A4P8IN92_9BURK|nr:helix-turn-helix domain-containing protein [Trinickia violacea]QCP49471.1 helix-turn-helix domain-containing protein [Trinickia violacea]
MSEPQHPQPHDNDTSAGPSEPASGQGVTPIASQPASAQAAPDSLAAVGARLAQLREAKGWSIDDVSARLKVASQKIRALESGDISQLPDTTFAVGVVRSYAKMLGVDPAPFTQALRREKGVPEPDLSMPASAGTGLPRGKVSVSLGGGPKHRSWLWGVAAVIVAVIALAMWHTGGGDSSAWLARLRAGANGATGGANGASASVVEGRTAASAAGAVENGASADAAASAAPAPNEASDPAAAASAAEQVPASVPVAAPAPATPAAASSSAPVVAPSASAPQAAAPAAKAASAAVAASSAADAASAAADAPAGESIVALRVTQDSWFNVRDKSGKEVFSGLVHAGDAKEISGEPPFKVTVGNKAGLDSLTLDGQPVDSAKYSAAKGNVARFSLP